MARFEVMSPAARRREGQKVRPAPRLDTLEGKTVALFWNSKPSGDLALEYVAAHFPGTAFKQYVGSIGYGRTSASDEDIEAIVSECQAVISATAD